MLTVGDRLTAKEMARRLIHHDKAVIVADKSSVGPYQTAVIAGETRRFLVTGNGKDQFFYAPQDAVEEFVCRVGLVSLGNWLSAHIYT